jgi:hypothetical protein
MLTAVRPGNSTQRGSGHFGALGHRVLQGSCMTCLGADTSSVVSDKRLVVLHHCRCARVANGSDAAVTTHVEAASGSHWRLLRSSPCTSPAYYSGYVPFTGLLTHVWCWHCQQHRLKSNQSTISTPAFTDRCCKFMSVACMQQNLGLRNRFELIIIVETIETPAAS